MKSSIAFYRQNKSQATKTWGVLSTLCCHGERDDWHLNGPCPAGNQNYLRNVFRSISSKMSRTAVKRKWSSLKRQLSDGDQGSWLSNEASPEFCVRLLRIPSIQTYCGIHSKLKSSTDDWMVEFLESNGMEVLLDALEKLSSLKLFVDAVMLLECTFCIKTVMNSKTGLDFMVGNRDFTRRLGRGKHQFVQGLRLLPLVVFMAVVEINFSIINRIRITKTLFHGSHVCL